MKTATNLPNELCCEILSYVTKRDLKHLRLSGKWRLAESAAPFLFDTAYLAARKGVIDTFDALVDHPILCHYVKHLIYDSSWIDPHIPGTCADENGNFTEDWSAAVEAVHTDKELALAFATQEDIQVHSLRRSLEKAFLAFSSLRTIKYADMARCATLPGDKKAAWSDLKFLTDRDIPRLFRQFPDRFALCCMSNECGGKHSNFFRRRFSGLSILLDLTHTHRHLSIQELSLGSGLQSAEIPSAGIPNFFFHESARSFPHFRAMFPHLRRLELDLSFHLTKYTARTNHVPPAGTYHEGLKKLLSAARALEVLYLSGQPWSGYPNYHDGRLFDGNNLDHCWPDGVMGSLRVLQLKYWRASFSRLASMARCNKRTLQHLELNDFDLRTESWPAVVTLCQNRIPKTKVVYGSTYLQGLSCYIDEGKALQDDDDDDDGQDENSGDHDSDDHAPTGKGSSRYDPEAWVGVPPRPFSDYNSRLRCDGEETVEDDKTVNENETTVENETVNESSTDSMEFESDGDTSDFLFD